MILPSIGLMSASCARLSLPPFPEPVRSPKTLLEETAAVEADASASPTSEPVGIRITSTPGVVIQRSVAEGIADRLGQNLQGDSVEVTFNDVPLVAFINEVFGEILGMSFVISPGLRRQQDLVTLKLTEPVPPSQLFATARRVLGSYGIDMRQEEDGMLSFFASQEVATRDVPLLVSGRTLPEVPVTHRTIFQLIPLRVARVAYVRGWLLEVFDRQELDVIEDDERNAIVLKGSRDVIERALAMIDVFDQPMLHGRHGIIMEPDFLKAKDLADMLQSILEAEGYNVSVNRPGGSVILLPLDGVDKLVAYALDRAALDRGAGVCPHPGCRAPEVYRQRAVHLRGAQHPGRGTLRHAQPDSRRRPPGAGSVVLPPERGAAANGADGRAPRRPQERQPADLPRFRRGMGGDTGHHPQAGQARALGADRGIDRRDHLGRRRVHRLRVPGERQPRRQGADRRPGWQGAGRQHP